MILSKNKIFLLLLAAVCIASCTSGYRENYQSEKPVLALYGELAADSVATIRLTHTFSIFDTDTDDPVVIGAKVILWQGGLPADTLWYNAATRQYTGDKKLVPLGEYYITASHPDYPDLWTEKVSILSFPTVALANQLDTSYSDDRGLHRDVYFNLNYDGFSSTDKFVIITAYFNSNQRIYPTLFNDCGHESFSNLSYNGLNMNCLNEKGAFLFKAEGLPRADSIPDSLTVQLGIVSPFFYSWNLAADQQASANTDQIFFQPVLVPSNINGGYGALLTKNIHPFKIILP
jgi:Domain of unknown function (DUF4249)